MVWVSMKVLSGIKISISFALYRLKFFLLFILFRGDVCYGVFFVCVKCVLYLSRILVSNSFFVSIVIVVGSFLTVLVVGSKYTVLPVAGSITGVSLITSTLIRH